MVKYLRELVGYFCYLWYCLLGKRESILSIYFHTPSASLFEKIICFLHKKGARFVSMEDFVTLLSDFKDTSVDKRVVFISFDDGWRNNIKLLPILEKYRIPMTLFVSTEPILSGNYWWEYPLAVKGLTYVSYLKRLSLKDFLDKINDCKKIVTLQRSAMTEEELFQLAQHSLVDIQSHTHPILTMCSSDILQNELVYSKKYLETFLHKSVEGFSYPNGIFSSDIVDRVREVGYRYAFTTQPTSIKDWEGDFLRIPRRSVNDKGGVYENISKIFGVWQKVLG